MKRTVIIVRSAQVRVLEAFNIKNMDNQLNLKTILGRYNGYIGQVIRRKVLSDFAKERDNRLLKNLSRVNLLKVLRVY